MKATITFARQQELEDIERKYYRIHPKKRAFPEISNNVDLIYSMHGLSNVLYILENGSPVFAKELFDKFTRRLEDFRQRTWGAKTDEVQGNQ